MTETQDTEALRDEIEATRGELGDTVEALAAKTDVKAQAKRKLEEKKEALADNPAPLAAGGGLLATIAVWRIVRRKRRKKR